MKYYLGVDPGQNGYLTVMSEDQSEIFSFPIPRVKEKVDELKLCELFDDLMKLNIVHCCIEDVHSVFGASAKSNWSFGYIVGFLTCNLITSKIPFTRVQPKVWQKELWQGIPLIKKDKNTDTKTMSLFAAERLFPNYNLLRTSRCKTPDDNLVDSLLIAEYCRRHFK